MSLPIQAAIESRVSTHRYDPARGLSDDQLVERVRLATGAMSGFDPAEVHRAFDLDERELPVMPVTAGHPAEREWRQKPHRSPAEVMRVA